MDVTTLASIPVVSAIVGYGTNYLAVKMVFRPRQPKKLLLLTYQGLIPRRQKEIAASIAKTIDRDLISHRDVQEALLRPEIAAVARATVKDEFEVIVEQLKQKNPMLAMFLQGEILQQINEILLAQVDAVAPRFMERIATQVEGTLDFRELVRQKIERFDLGKLEALIYEISSRELRAIEILGGVLGFVVGIVQVFICLSLE